MISFTFRASLLICFYFLLCLSSKEQISLPDYSVTNYNSDNALPQNSINDMAFDRNGFLWMATEMGVVRFDGKLFREYNMENSPALPANRCNLISTLPGSGKIIIEPLFASHHIMTVSDDFRLETDSLLSANPHQSNLWDNQLFSFENLFEKQVLEDHTGKNRRLFDKLDREKNLITVNEKQAYLNKDSACYFLDENTGDIVPLKGITGHRPKVQFAVGDICFYVDEHNQLYAYKNGILQKNITCCNGLYKFLSLAGPPKTDPMQSVLSIKRDGRHTFMVYKGNILLLEIKGDELDYQVLAANTSIFDIKCLIYDEEYHILYIGSLTNGLYVLKKHEFDRLFFSSPRYVVNSLYAQVELQNGEILTSSGILKRGENGRLFPDSCNIDRYAFLQASDGSIWYSENEYLKKADSHFRNPVIVKVLGSWLTFILETGNKELVYSTGHKLFLRNGKEETTLLDHAELLHNANILSLMEISPGNLWIGTSKGLYTYDIEHHLPARYPGLDKTAIRNIFRAKDGSIWIGTYGQGFYKFYKNGFVKMPMDLKKNLATVHCFMEDDHGFFWMPTNRGLFRVAKKELDDYAAGTREKVFYYYSDKSSGFTSNEFNGGCTPCGIVTRDRRFSLPSLDGLVQFHPDSIHINFPDKPLFIDQVTTDYKNSAVKNTLVLNRNFNRVIFEISSPYFGNQANLHLEYLIKELSEKWYPVNDDRRLTLTELPHGAYTLIIRKQDGYADYTYKTVRLNILPYWYETTSFRCLAACLGIGIFLLFFRIRYNFQVRRAEQLEQKVTERTQELSESNRVKEIMIATILHDFQSPLRFLHLLAKSIYGNFKRSSEKELAEILSQFETATNDLYNFAQGFLIWTNTQKKGFLINPEKIVLREITEDIISLYKVGANIHQNTFINLVPGNITLTTDANLLKLIIRNLADNANKYTSEGEIKIEAIRNETTVSIIMTDTGTSMDSNLVKNILRNNYNPSTNQGWGYKIIMELLVRLNGTILITPSDKQDNGNRITLNFRAETAS